MPSKSGFSRTRNVEYEDDDTYDDNHDEYFDEADDTADMTTDDKEQMRIGVIRVRESLGDMSGFATDAQIQEALWHYYYDVGKTLTYLKNKLDTKPKHETPRKEKMVSRFDHAAKTADLKAPHTTGKHMSAQHSYMQESAYPVVHSYSLASPSMHSNYASPSDFFWDVPWGAVPLHRLGNIIIDGTVGKIGLLGGSSKLATLAAKRRKEREKTSTVDVTRSTGDTDAAIVMLDKLSMKNDEQGAKMSAARTNTKTERQTRAPAYPVRKRSSSPSRRDEARIVPVEEHAVPPPAIVVDFPARRASASRFACTLCGPEKAELQPLRELRIFSLPYAQQRNHESLKAFAGLSPDDITGISPKKKKKTTAAAANNLVGPVEGLSVDESRTKSKNLNVLEEFEKSGLKRTVSFVVIGHVDHGKSTLMGRLLYDLKVIDQRSVSKLRQEASSSGKTSFALAWILDETSEERTRGITVDIATKFFETDSTRFTILDAPGHKDFIPNMISGASQADFPVLVIDASTNSFESGLKGQTKEHILIARSMGMQHIVVAVNKMDTIAWSKTRFDEISKQMSTLLMEASFLDKKITFVPLAGFTGENVVQKAENPAAHWYTGETLLEVLERIEVPHRNLQKGLRLSVADVFRGDVRLPLSISGRIDSGTLQVGEGILALPANETAIIKAIEVQDLPVDWAIAGQIATLHLTDIDPVHLRQGDIICTPKAPVKLVKAFTSKLLAFEHVLPMPVEVFRTTLNSPGNIRTLSAKLNKFTGEVVKKKPRMIKPGEVARMVVQLDRELPIEEGMRVVLREGGRTVGAGLMENVA